MTAPNPLVSVVLPVCNGEQYLKHSIESLLNQTFPRFELIIVNDGSTDATESIVRSYSDSRIRYMTQENTGIGGALRNGCNMASGKYIARMDADDFALPHRFEQQVAWLESHPGTVVLSSAVQYIDETGKTTGRSFPYTTNRAIRKKLNLFNPVCHPAVMMRTEAYRRSVGYLDIQPFEDHILWLSMAKLGYLQNFRFPLLKYRLLPGSVSRVIPPEKMQDLFLYLKQKMHKGYLDESEIEEYNCLYRHERAQAGKISATPGEDATPASGSSAPDTQQLIYGTLQRLRIPEPAIEFFLCTGKSLLA
jgi:glycosyltransferase involved in cell wall biosynthesis